MSFGTAAVVARTVRDRLNGLEFRSARALLRAADDRPIDVLYLGDSLNHAFHRDGDTRPLAQMMTEQLGPDVSFFAVSGGGYHPRLWQAFLDLLGPGRAPKVVVHSLSCRLPMAPWALHPLYHYTAQISVMQDVAAGASPRRLRGGFPPPSREEMRRYEALTFRTMLGEHEVGEYLRRTRQGDEADRERWLYAFHHTGRIGVDTPGLPALRQLAATLGERGVAPVVFHAPVSVDVGVELLGDGFTEHLEANLDALDREYRTAYGRDLTVLPFTREFRPEEFVDPRDGTEHLLGPGRRRLADRLVAEIEGSLQRRDAITGTDSVAKTA